MDAKHKLVAAADLTNDVTDLNQLANVALEAQANLAVKQTEVLADKGYYNASQEVSRCNMDKGITPFIPKADTSANTKQGLFGKSKFSYDAQQDVYHCPGNPETNLSASAPLSWGEAFVTTGPTTATPAP